MPLETPGATLAEFPATSERDWRDAVAAALKGASFERLRTPTAEGYTIEPIYPRAAAAGAIVGARGATPWTIVQRIDLTDPAEANAQALADLEGAAGGLDLVFSGSIHARGHGLASDDVASLDRLLAGVMLDLITLRIDAGPASAAIGATIVELAGAAGIAPAGLTITLASDPVATAARLGGSPRDLATDLAEAATAAKALASRGAGGLLAMSDGRVWHEAGASRVETLAAMLASAVAQWRALEAAGMAAEAAIDRIGFTLAIDQGQFSGMAEIRALRLLWSRIRSAAGLEEVPVAIHAETSFRMMSRLDANTNLIRATIAAFAAGVGGADSVTVLPYSAANGLAETFARRLTRNIQSVLIEEANLFRVADAAAGSGRVEAETLALAEAAWAMFREIEAEGGIVAALRAGSLQARIAATAAARARDIARRKVPLTGVSEFPILGQAPVPVIAASAPSAPPLALADTFPPLPCHRLSEPFEALRDAATVARPRVFLANLGRIADFNTRSAWVKNLLESGGIETLGNNGFATLDELVAGFVASGARAVCLASSDAVYAAEGEAALARLTAAGAGPVFFAGKPADAEQEARWRAAGVDVFLFAGQDVLAVLADAAARIAAVA